MLHVFFDDKPWFAPKRLGFGTGLPIAWQGWVLLGIHISLIIGVTLFLAHVKPGIYHGHPAVLLLIEATIIGLPMPLYAAKTRGGWKWRNGGEAE